MYINKVKNNRNNRQQNIEYQHLKLYKKKKVHVNKDKLNNNTKSYRINQN